MTLRNVLVTGANKGIGEAIVRKILTEYDNVFVILGSRNLENGLSAKSKIINDIPKSAGRIEVMVIDVSDDSSVKAASTEAAEKYKSLYGIVNNAGLGSQSNYKDVLNVNFLGIKRVFENFLYLLSKDGKVVNVTSAAGPKFIEQMETGSFKDALTSKHVTWQQLEEIMNSYFTAQDSGNAQHLFGDIIKKEYYISKALANSYTILIAREHPSLIINACTPGYIATDMTRSHWESVGKTPEEIGAKPVEHGAYSPCHLLFNVETSGKFYGSDGLRSPLHRYRGAGEKEYESEAEEEVGSKM